MMLYNFILATLAMPSSLAMPNILVLHDDVKGPGSPQGIELSALGQSEEGNQGALSDAYKKFLDGLHAKYTSRLQYDTILDLWGLCPNRPPIDTHHPAVRTHTVTGLKTLKVNPGFVTMFAELKEIESGTSTMSFYYTG
ncbi:uncharacterized protein BDV17DRAFT_294356 [Aspergillus undulatus]|uniref:uncharacterized protein n=1 Tax=Aspergillus undulatus TaxID=1810928 RepID=UPI003CCDE7D7